MSNIDKTLKGMSSVVEQLLETAQAQLEVAQSQEKVATARSPG